jgi:ubiquinone/menaquinone biosynthesis C-methylase UbiE
LFFLFLSLDHSLDTGQMSIYEYLFGRLAMTIAADEGTALNTTGRVLHWALRYDLLVCFVSLGREGRFREKTLDFAKLKPGESVLDVGCGTGTLAIAAKKRVHRGGRVCGIDASPEMIARAKNKASKAGLEVLFQTGLAEAQPFPDGEFDAVLATVMLHHLPREPRQQCAREILRVLKPGGRVLAVDFGAGTGERTWLPGHFHTRHGRVAPQDLTALFREAGFPRIENGTLGIGDLHFVLAEAPRAPVGSAVSANGTNP